MNDRNLLWVVVGAMALLGALAIGFLALQIRSTQSRQDEIDSRQTEINKAVAEARKATDDALATSSLAQKFIENMTDTEVTDRIRRIEHAVCQGACPTVPFATTTTTSTTAP